MPESRKTFAAFAARWERTASERIESYQEGKMIQIRPSEERGHAQMGWLDTHHTFSFDQYYDPEYMGFGPLRVINEDVVAPGRGFGMHPHRDMEILTYVLEGSLEHRDNMGSGAVIRPGDLQTMTAGTGVMHSEFNPSRQSPVHLLQIWIEPDKKGLKPKYEQHTFPAAELEGGFHLLAGKEGVITIHQDASLYVARFAAGEEASHSLKENRRAWLQVARGSIDLNGLQLKAGDGAAITAEKQVTVRAKEDSEVLLFDLP
jgi:redox-sensitive bicupin YhaK (pirin superfamily)